jgi:hypothetical protein
MNTSIAMQVSPGTIQTVWWLSILIVLVVTAVVALLLTLVKRTATQILEGAGAIWTHGQLVANDTIQIPIFLKETNHVAGQILATATEIVGATDMIEQHAKGCPGCPACVLETGRER